MTVKQLRIACEQNRFILARFNDNYQMGINCLMAPIALRRQKYRDNARTDYVSYTPCDFQTYISRKHPLI